MAQEIERKFLVTGDDYRSYPATYYKQGYITTAKSGVVRVRIVDKDAYLTIKGENHGATRSEYEYKIPLSDAEEMLATLCQQPLITKYRYRCAIGNLVWEIDEFLEENLGLIIAEVELPNENYSLTPPSWIGCEVTSDSRYYNSSLVTYPYSTWK